MWNPRCPICGRPLRVIGSRPCHLFCQNGTKKILIIRRPCCDSCHRIHHEIPDAAVPYKLYSTEACEKVISSRPAVMDQFCGENSTIIRLRAWFSSLHDYFIGVLEALRFRYRTDNEMLEQRNTLNPLSPPELAADWLAHLVRLVVNSGRWRQTRSACSVLTMFSTDPDDQPRGVRTKAQAPQIYGSCSDTMFSRIVTASNVRSVITNGVSNSWV